MPTQSISPLRVVSPLLLCRVRTRRLTLESNTAAVTLIKRKRPRQNQTERQVSALTTELRWMPMVIVVRVTPSDNTDVACILPTGFVMLLVPSNSGGNLARLAGQAKSLAFGKIQAMSHSFSITYPMGRHVKTITHPMGQVKTFTHP